MSRLPRLNRCTAIKKIIDEMNNAWQRAGNGQLTTEAGFTAEGQRNNYTIGRSHNTGQYSSLEITITTSTFALFHTHPNSKNQKPLGADQGIARGDVAQRGQNGPKQPFPVYTITNRGLWVYDPSKGKNAQPQLLRPNLEWQNPCP